MNVLPVSFLARVMVATDGCWLWIGYADRDGYGRYSVGRGRQAVAHRFAYEQTVGPIPDGMQLDHFVCDTPACCNPRHVRPVTPRENVLRSRGWPAVNLAKTHCPKDHPYDDANTYVGPTGRRTCRTCGRYRQNVYAAKKRDERRRERAA